VKKIAVVVLALALLMTFAAVPVFAAPPTRGTFSQGIVQVGVTSGKSFVNCQYSPSFLTPKEWKPIVRDESN